jgi:hypothetical protein
MIKGGLFYDILTIIGMANVLNASVMDTSRL